MSKIVPFEEKYKDLWKEWNLDEKITSYIIRRYSKKLEEEMKRLTKEKINLPRYFRDRRSDEEYVYDLIDGWLIEDIICDAWLSVHLKAKNDRIYIRHMGTNRDRNLQKYNPRKITTDPDFIYEIGKRQFSIELQMSRKERKREGYDMKESKVERAIKNKNLFLWVIIPTSTYFFIDPIEYFENSIAEPNFLWGGKKVFTIKPDQLENIGVEKIYDGISEKYYKILGI